MAAKPAIVLLSGGLDSTTVCAFAASKGYDVYALTIAYGQLHESEITAAHRVARTLDVKEHRTIELDLARLAHSALTKKETPVAKNRSFEEITQSGIPETYVPARNTIFLSLALAWAETIGARDLFIGVNELDVSGYPDCSPEFISAFEALANIGTRARDEGEKYQIHAPLKGLDKAGIIQLGLTLGVDYSMTHTCYEPTTDGGACGACDACLLRKRGFQRAGVSDPTRYG